MITVQEKLNAALNFHHAGNISQAEDLYNEILKDDPENDVVLYFMGIIAFQRKNIEFAIQNISKAIALNPMPDYFRDLGNIYFEINQHSKAVECFKKFLEHAPEDVDVLFNLGLSYLELKQLDEALKVFSMLEKLLPEDFEVCNNLAMILHQKNNIHEAVEKYKKAISLNPDLPGANYNLGIIYHHIKKDNESALAYYQRAVELKPDYAEANNNIGAVLSSKNCFEESIIYFEAAIKLKSDYAEAYFNLGWVYQCLLELDKSVDFYNKAIELKPDYAEAIFNIGCINLLKGNYEEGWKGQELGFRLKYPDMLRHTQEKWDKDNLHGKTVYITYLGGYGDTIQFARYINQLSEMADKVIFRPNKGLESLFKDSSLKAEIIDHVVPDHVIKYDLLLPAALLPYVFNTMPENIPLRNGYIKANKSKAELYKKEYFNNDEFKIGISWQGDPTRLTYRFMPLTNFYPISQLNNTKIYSLQKGFATEQLENLPEDVNIINLGKTFNDFSDTAAAVENLDLVITADTSIAHLSASMNKPTWILIPFPSEWRWGLNVDYSLWYDSVKLFRQKEINKWQDTFNDILQNLNKII